MKLATLFLMLLVTGSTVFAQDTTRRKEVSITSTFKPVLKEAAKINLNASPQLTDTSRPRLQYNIPNQNLSFAFQPGSLKPLALQVDTGGSWNMENYFKLGFGNLSTPFAQAGISLGDKKAGLNIYAKHVSSKGKIEHQDYSNTNVDLNAYFQTPGNLEWNARFGGLQEKYKKFGFIPDTLDFADDSIDVKFQTWRARVGFRNINRTEFGLSYAPELKIDVFNDGLSNSESNTLVNLPLQKTIGEKFAVDLAVSTGLNRYKPEDKETINNNFISISPSLLYRASNINIQAGLRPTWDNGDFKLFPNVMTEFATSDTRFSFQAGWAGYIRYQGFQHMAGMNSWIWAPDSILNSRIEERYAGFKGSVGNHFTYSAKVAYNKVTNQPLYINDTMSGKSFIVINEPEMKVVNFGGEVGFTAGEKFSVISHLNFNQYNPSISEKAWGLIPVEFNTNLRIQVLKDLYVNASLFAFDGPWSFSKTGRSNLQGAMDLSAGAEFRIVKNIKLWAQFNNILNKEYQRWNQYPVYGFNFLGGVVFSFAQNN